MKTKAKSSNTPPNRDMKTKEQYPNTPTNRDMKTNTKLSSNAPPNHDMKTKGKLLEQSAKPLYENQKQNPQTLK
jgi:hypothetical protein